MRADFEKETGSFRLYAELNYNLVPSPRTCTVLCST